MKNERAFIYLQNALLIMFLKPPLTKNSSFKITLPFSEIIKNVHCGANICLIFYFTNKYFK